MSRKCLGEVRGTACLAWQARASSPSRGSERAPGRLLEGPSRLGASPPHRLDAGLEVVRGGEVEPDAELA